jgi:DNA adenine methylase
MQLALFESAIVAPDNSPSNVASVPQRSPFRYPGGKTWLIPVVRQWLRQAPAPPSLLVEPFVGGGVVSLTAAFEALVGRVIMSEIDPEIAAVWEVLLSADNQQLAEQVLRFDLTPANAQDALQVQTPTLLQQAFCTILKNRIQHGGIITKGSGWIKNGENGKGLASRWYPKTLYNRITAIQFVREKIKFYRQDAFEIIEKYADYPEAYFFIAPPYAAAGKRLYTFHQIDHERLFQTLSTIKGRFMLTYDDAPEVRNLADKYSIAFRTIPMKTTHHREKHELILSDHLNW